MGNQSLMLDALRYIKKAYYQNLDRTKSVKSQKRIEHILSNQNSPSSNDCEELFLRLQDKYPRHGHKYKYDAYSSWLRGSIRAQQLLKTIDHAKILSKEILEIGCGDGMTGASLSFYGHKVTLIDTKDWRDRRSKQNCFVKGNVCKELPIESDCFDLVYSYNTFEHLEDPRNALKNIVRTCKQGGFIFLEFGPLYWSPWGLHAKCLNMPYPQALFSEKYNKTKIKELKNQDLGQETLSIQPLNKWRVRQYDELWRSSGCEIISLEKLSIFSHIDIVEKYPASFRGRGLSYEDITVYAFRVLLYKH